MGLVFSLLVSLLGFGATIGFWFALTLVLTFLLAPVYADLGYVYGPEDSADYATWIMMLIVFWDRYFGPYGRLLRGVAKYLPKGRKTVTESNETDELDYQ